MNTTQEMLRRRWRKEAPAWDFHTWLSARMLTGAWVRAKVKGESNTEVENGAQSINQKPAEKV